MCFRAEPARGLGSEKNDSDDNVAVKLPNGDSRRLSAGPCSELTKQVIEIFAPRFPKMPTVIFMT
ncbi:BsuBI/PstI family type II restriction endonuclease [Hyphomicrobium sp. DY-1]|uniref:BsuBI/PstI family type II restriction endonuclease n=1 Tax=Hyphomicrobium sp. DY-1 TaxID=3075650 RepID=UPI0039C09669